MARSTWHWDPEQGKLVEGPGPRRSDGSGDGWRFSDRLYSGKPFKGHDGTVIDSKRKHREYMKRNGLTTMDDFKGHWDRKAQERAQFYTPGAGYDRAARRDAVARALEKHRGS
jgi:hypothetical protein